MYLVISDNLTASEANNIIMKKYGIIPSVDKPCCVRVIKTNVPYNEKDYVKIFKNLDII